MRPSRAALRDEFAKRLQRAMEEKGWSQSELARAATRHMQGKRFGRDSISLYIMGTSLPSAARLRALCKALGVERADLVPSMVPTETPAVAQDVQQEEAILLTPKQAADRLEVSTASLALWHRHGRIRAAFVTPGGLARYAPEDVEELRQSREASGEAQRSRLMNRARKKHSAESMHAEATGEHVAAPLEPARPEHATPPGPNALPSDYRLDDVREAMQRLAAQKSEAAVWDLLQRYGSPNASCLPVELRDAFIGDAEAVSAGRVPQCSRPIRKRGGQKSKAALGDRAPSREWFEKHAGPSYRKGDMRKAVAELALARGRGAVSDLLERYGVADESLVPLECRDDFVVDAQRLLAVPEER